MRVGHRVWFTILEIGFKFPFLRRLLTSLPRLSHLNSNFIPNLLLLRLNNLLQSCQLSISRRLKILTSSSVKDSLNDFNREKYMAEIWFRVHPGKWGAICLLLVECLLDITSKLVYLLLSTSSSTLRPHRSTDVYPFLAREVELHQLSCLVRASQESCWVS